MRYVDSSELQKLPYVVNKPNGNQVVYLHPFFDDDKKKFIDYVPNENKEFIFLYAEPVESFYYSKSKIGIEKDLFLDFFDVLICKYSYNFTTNYVESIAHDILNLSAVFEKYFILLNYISENPDKHQMILIKTEIEYFFGVIRSIYDLLQKLIKKIVKNYVKIELPNSYADMFDKGTYEVKSNWPELPQRLSSYYNSTVKLIFICRDIRDGVHHKGITNHFIYHFEDGFGIPHDLFNFSEFDIWPQDKIKENDLVSLLALFAYVTKAVIQNMNNLASVFLKEFEPQNIFISNDYTILLRGTCTEHLNKLDKYLDEQWFKKS